MKLGDYYEGYYKGYMRYLAPGTAQGYDGDWRVKLLVLGTLKG